MEEKQMKKIVALALCLIMALSLATVAFAAVVPVTEAEAGKLYEYDNEDDVLTVGVAASKVAAKAATASKKGNVAYYTTDGTDFYVEVAETKAEAAYYTGSKLVYLKEATCVEYDTSSYVFAYEAGKTVKCGEITGYNYDAVFTKTDAAGTTTKYIAYDANGDYAKAYGTADHDFVLVDGTIYAVWNTAVDTVKDHTWKAKTYDEDGKVAAAICSVCGATGKVVTAAEYATAAASVKVGNPAQAGFEYVILTSAAATTTSGVTSAKTFDAGVALYAGMALMSVAGSAVVIGKKKEF